MTDISITAANVVVAAGATQKPRGIAGVAVTAGQVGYYDPADDRWKLADSDSGTAIARLPAGTIGGIFLNGAGVGQPVAVLESGPVTIGGTLTAGVAYYLSNTAGGICPVADVGSGETAVFLGMAISTTVLDFQIKSSGVQL